MTALSLKHAEFRLQNGEFQHQRSAKGVLWHTSVLRNVRDGCYVRRGPALLAAGVQRTARCGCILKKNKNHGFCTNNDGFPTKTCEFHTKDDEFILKMTNSFLN